MPHDGVNGAHVSISLLASLLHLAAARRASHSAMASQWERFESILLEWKLKQVLDTDDRYQALRRSGDSIAVRVYEEEKRYQIGWLMRRGRETPLQKPKKFRIRGKQKDSLEFVAVV